MKLYPICFFDVLDSRYERGKKGSKMTPNILFRTNRIMKLTFAEMEKNVDGGLVG